MPRSACLPHGASAAARKRWNEDHQAFRDTVDTASLHRPGFRCAAAGNAAAIPFVQKEARVKAQPASRKGKKTLTLKQCGHYM
jgi:hypothetical protein